ncbi:MAG: hypothetical protein ACQEWV_09275 [Bacillota bacterium]
MLYIFMKKKGGTSLNAFLNHSEAVQDIKGEATILVGGFGL